MPILYLISEQGLRMRLADLLFRDVKVKDITVEAILAIFFVALERIAWKIFPVVIVECL